MGKFQIVLVILVLIFIANVTYAQDDCAIQIEFTANGLYEITHICKDEEVAVPERITINGQEFELIPVSEDLSEEAEADGEIQAGDFVTPTEFVTDRSGLNCRNSASTSANVVTRFDASDQLNTVLEVVSVTQAGGFTWVEVKLPNSESTCFAAGGGNENGEFRPWLEETAAP